MIWTFGPLLMIASFILYEYVGEMNLEAVVENVRAVRVRRSDMDCDMHVQ